MKKLLLFGAFCALSTVSQAAPKVAWRTDYNAALKESKRLKKPIFIDFYTEWCGPCKYMEKTTHVDSTFVKESRNWVMVKINPEKSALGARVASKYKVTGFPTMVFTDSNGKVLDFMAGFAQAPWQEWLAPKMNNAKAKFRK